jgi:hypothetical protein
MDTSSVVLYGLIGLAVICFVLDRWVLPRDPSPPPPDPEAEMRAAEERRREAVFREADLQLERERIRRMRKECVFSLNAIVDPRDVLPTLTISCSGKVPWHEFSRQFVTLELEDITDAEPRLIRCSDPDFCDPASGFCRFSPDIVLPSDELLAGSWNLAKVPLSTLSAPYAGRRLVRINYQLGPRGSVPEDVTKRAVYVLEVNLFNVGYEDTLGQGRVAVCTMELAIACGLAGRSRLGPALKVLSPWVDLVLNAVKQEDASRFPALRDALDHLWSEGLPEDYGVEKACALIAVSGRNAVDEAMELCLHMSTADEAWPMPAIQLLRRIAGLMGLSTSECQAMLDRHLLGSTVRTEACDWESLVGLNPSLDRQGIRKHLAAQFDRWNSRAPSARTTAEQARIRTILETIAKLKQKYA